MTNGSASRRSSKCPPSNDPARLDPFRIYIDTSVPGGCFDREFATGSNALVRDFRARRFIPVLSDVTAAEVQEAPETGRDLHQELLALVDGVLPLTEEALSLVAAYEARKIQPPK